VNIRLTCAGLPAPTVSERPTVSAPASAAMTARRITQSILQRTAEETGETSCFYIREGGRRICLYRASAPVTLRSHVEEGAELPLDRGASAHILVAYTDGVGEFHEAIRSRGYYISHGERDPETKAAAVPVFGPDKKLIGSLGVTGPKNRFDEANCERFVGILTEKAQALSRMLSGR
jgi:DNA-binding IclR family transcriptional regulator